MYRPRRIFESWPILCWKSWGDDVEWSFPGVYWCESSGVERRTRELVSGNACRLREGHMHILMLNETEVQRLLDPDALLDALAEGFKALSDGLVAAPKRNEVSVPDTGFLLAMPAYQHGREVTVKLVSVFHGNERLGIPGHTGGRRAFDDGGYGKPVRQGQQNRVEHRYTFPNTAEII